MQINVIHPHQVNFFWPTIERHIQASQQRGPSDMTVQEIKDHCRVDNSWRLLIFDHFDGAAVVRVWDHWLHVVAIGGKLEAGWMFEFYDYLVKIARYIGAKYITLGGRKGWTRKLAPLGFKPIGGPFLGVAVQQLEDEP